MKRLLTIDQRGASWLSMLSVLVFLTVSCGTARRGEPVAGKLAFTDERIKHGEIVFMKNCQQCHPGGEAGVGPPLNNLPLPGGLIKFRVRSKAFLLGLGRMPSFKKHEIPGGDLHDLVKYMKALRKQQYQDKQELVRKDK